MRLSEKARRLVEEYGILPDPQERFSFLLEASEVDPGLAPEERRPDLLVEGCMSRVWVDGRVDDEGRMQYRSDSDAPMVKAIAWLLSDFYSGAPPQEVQSTEPEFLNELRLLHALTENRRRGTRQIVARIQALARDAA